MRYYSNPMEMVKEVERDLFEMGIHVQSDSSQNIPTKDNEDYKTVELTGYSYKLGAPFTEDQLKELANYLKVPYDWIEAEFSERVLPPGFDGEIPNPGEAWKLRRNVWEHLLVPNLYEDEPEPYFSYTYGGRYYHKYDGFGMNQIDRVVNELKENKNSRQVILEMYMGELDGDRWGARGDVEKGDPRHRIPCSMHYQFMIRNDKLSCVYVMRSCDFLTFFGSDIILTLKLQNEIAKRVGIEPGMFTHFIGSLHAYYKDMKERGIF